MLIRRREILRRVPGHANRDRGRRAHAPVREGLEDDCEDGEEG